MQNMTYFDRMKISAAKVSAEAREKALDKANSTESSSTGGGAWSRVLGVRRAETTGEDGEGNKLGGILNATEADGQLNVETAKRMLRWLAEAVGRSLELSPSADTPKDVLSLLTLLIDHMRKIYLETALDVALETAENQGTKNEPDFTYFGEIKPATTIMHLMFSFITTALIPLASSALTVRREMTILTNASIAGLESKINAVEQKTLDIVLAWITQLLSKQKKQDYRPKDDDVSLTTLQSSTCQSIITFLNKVHNLATSTLSGQNLNSFLTELGSSLLGLLLEHIKKFTINAAGGLMLTKDMSAYHVLIKGWGVKELREGFELLHEIAKLFVVGQGALRERLADKSGVLAKVRHVQLKVWLCKREDYASAGIEKLLSE